MAGQGQQQVDDEIYFEEYETPRTVAVSRRGGARFYTWRRLQQRGRTGYSYPNRVVHMLESERDGYFQEYQRVREFRLEAIRYHDLAAQHEADRDHARQQAVEMEALYTEADRLSTERAARIAQLEADLIAMTLDRDAAMERHQYYRTRMRARLYEAYHLTEELAMEEVLGRAVSEPSEAAAPMESGSEDEDSGDSPAGAGQVDFVAISDDTRDVEGSQQGQA